MKATDFRICGPEIGIRDSCVDVVVSGLGNDGSVYLKDKKADREWEFTSDRIAELREDDLLLEDGEVSKTTMWDRLDKLEQDREQGTVENPFAIEKVEAAQRALFQAAFEETR